MKFSPVTLVGVVLASLLAPLTCRADLIPWMYNWSRSPSVINADAPGTGYITLTDETLKSAVGDSDVVATNLRTYSTATAGSPDVFTAKAYSLSLYLYDSASGQGGTLTFTGQLDGKLTALSSNLKNTFTGMTTQSIILGTNKYTATIGPYSPPGIPGSSNSGSISAHATITVESVVDTPEPGSLILSGIGFTVVTLGRLRNRRRRSPA